MCALTLTKSQKKNQSVEGGSAACRIIGGGYIEFKVNDKSFL